MSDIVKRLRKGAWLDTQWQAADRIERLEDALRVGLRYFGDDAQTVVLTLVEDGSTLIHFQETARAALQDDNP